MSGANGTNLGELSPTVSTAAPIPTQTTFLDTPSAPPLPEGDGPGLVSAAADPGPGSARRRSPREGFPPRVLVPLLPDLRLPRTDAPEPQVLELRAETRAGELVARLDAADDRLPSGLKPGVAHWLIALWPPGAGRPEWYPGGLRKIDPLPEPRPTGNPAAPGDFAAAVAGAVAAAMAPALQGIASALQTMAQAQATQAVKPAEPAQPAWMQDFMGAMVRRAMEPPAPPPSLADQVQQMQGLMGIMEGFGRWQQNGGKPTAPEREPTAGETFVQALEVIGETVQALPANIAAARAGGGGLPSAAAILSALQTTPEPQLGAWLADAARRGIIGPNLLAEDPEHDVPPGGMLIEALNLEGPAAAKLQAAARVALAALGE